jgi:hypothetical protein
MIFKRKPFLPYKLPYIFSTGKARDTMWFAAGAGEEVTHNIS